MGRSISGGASGGQVTVSGSVQTINPVEYSPEAPDFVNRPHYSQNIYVRKNEYFINDIENSDFVLTRSSPTYQAWYVVNPPSKMWTSADIRLHIQYSLYSDFREVYEEYIQEMEAPTNVSGTRFCLQPFYKDHHNDLNGNRANSSSPNPYAIPWAGSSNSSSMSDIFVFPDSDCKLYFRGRWMLKTDGSSGSFSEPICIYYNPLKFKLNCGIAGLIEFDQNFNEVNFNYFANGINQNLGYSHIGSLSNIGFDTRLQSPYDLADKILKPNTDYTASLGNATERTFFKFRSSENQNFFLDGRESSVSDWPAGDYDIYIIGNGLSKPQFDGSTTGSNQYDGGPAGEIVKISKSFTSPFTANASNTSYSSRNNHTYLTIDGVEVGRALNGGGAAGGTWSGDTNVAGADAPWILKTAGTASDYARRCDYTLYSNGYLSGGHKSESGNNGLGFGAGIQGQYYTATAVSGYGGSGFGDIFINNTNNWGVVFVHKP